MAEALYRKYRPQVFGDVIGQDHVEQTLKNAIEQDKVSHAYLFCGPRGTGKTTMARLLAKALLCKDAPTSHPDGSCEDCRLIAAGIHPDVYELDAASRTGVENVREEIIGRVQFAPTRGTRKIYIIDEVHMLSTAAFNALLKTLEEPPSHVIFILATTDPQKVPETIHSRCQRFDFRRISPESLVSRMGAICVAEGVEFEGDALDLIAHRAEGGMRNALTALEQLIAFSGGKVTLAAAEEMLGGMATSDMAEIVAAIGRRDAAACFSWVADYVETGADLAVFTRDLAEHIRNLYVLSLGGVGVPLEVSEAVRRQMVNELAYFGPDRLARTLCVLGDLSAELKTSTNARLSFEIAMTRLVRPSSDLTLESLAERLEALESAGVRFVTEPAGAKVAASSARAEFRATDPAQNSVSSGLFEQAASAPVDSAERLEALESAGVRVAAESQAKAEPMVEPKSQLQPEPEPEPEPQAKPVPKVASRPGWGKQNAGAARKSARKANLANPAALQRSWQQVLSALKRINPSHSVMFIGAKVSYDPNTDGFAVKFPQTYEYMFHSSQKPEVRQSLHQAIVQVLEEEVPVMLVRLSAEGKAQEVVPAFGNTAAVPQKTAPQQEEVAQGKPVQEKPAKEKPVQRESAFRTAPVQEEPAQQKPVPRQVPVQVETPAVSSAVADDEVPLDIYESFGIPELEEEPPMEPVRAAAPQRVVGTVPVQKADPKAVPTQKAVPAQKADVKTALVQKAAGEAVPSQNEAVAQKEEPAQARRDDDAWRSSLFEVFGEGVRLTEEAN